MLRWDFRSEQRRTILEFLAFGRKAAAFLKGSVKNGGPSQISTKMTQKKIRKLLTTTLTISVIRRIYDEINKNNWHFRCYTFNCIWNLIFFKYKLSALCFTCFINNSYFLCRDTKNKKYKVTAMYSILIYYMYKKLGSSVLPVNEFKKLYKVT